MLIFSHFQIYKHAFPLFLINSFNNDDMKLSKRHVFLVSLIFLLKCYVGASVKQLTFFNFPGITPEAVRPDLMIPMINCITAIHSLVTEDVKL